MKDWIQTACGRAFRPLSPDAGEVRIEDIAHALANKCRFTGHSREFYSVAEHSIHVASILPPELRLAGLLHDASEAYLPDVAAPVKAQVYCEIAGIIVPFRVAEDRVMRTILLALGVDAPVHAAAVKRADLAVLAAEKRALMRRPPRAWKLRVPAANVCIEALAPRAARRAFMNAYRRYDVTVPRTCISPVITSLPPPIT